MERGEVVDADGIRLSPDTAVRPGMCVFYYREIDNEPCIPFDEDIVYQDDHILVADKPHFLPVIPSGRFLHETLLIRLKRKTGLSHLTPIHRIDRETAGLVVFSHQPNTRGAYQSLFQKKEIRKSYEALAGTLDTEFPFTYKSRMVEGEPFFRMRETEGIPNSETFIDLIEKRGAMSHYRLHPLTGKKHQLRVHLAALGAPIANDGFYPEALPCKADDTSRPLKLLAKALAFKDPVTGMEHCFNSGRSLSWESAEVVPGATGAGFRD